MSDDHWLDPGFNDSDDAAVFYSVPTDHPAFRHPEDDQQDVGDFELASGYGGTDDEIGSPILHFPVGRYDGYGDQDNQESSGVLGTGDSGQRAADARFLADKLEQSKRDDGTRSIREHAVAREHSGGVDEGERVGADGAEPSLLRDQLAASLEQAGIRFRDEPGTDHSAVDAFLNSTDSVKTRGGWNRGSIDTAPLVRSSRGINKPPAFQKTSLRGQLYGLKSNTAGDWILSLRIDADCFAEVAELASGHGLALEIAIRRKPRDGE